MLAIICMAYYLGKWLVLYFYSKDNTSGCTREAVDFTVALPVLRDLGASVLGVSRDSPASHRKFAEKHSLKVMLASDQEHKVTQAYGAWALKKMYGKEAAGAGAEIAATTFNAHPISLTPSPRPLAPAAMDDLSANRPSQIKPILI